MDTTESTPVKTKTHEATTAEDNKQRAGGKKTRSPTKTSSKKETGKASIIGSSSGEGTLKPSHPEITMQLLEIALNQVTAEHRVQVATAHGIVPNLLHMSWANVQKKKILKIVRDGL